MTGIELPYQFNEVYGLGAVHKAYPVKKFAKWGNLIFGIILLLVTAGLLIGGLVYAYNIASQYGRIMFWGSLWPWLLGAVLSFGLAVLLFANAVISWRKQAVLYEKGFAYLDRKGLVYMQWEEMDWLKAEVVRHYTNGIPTGVTHRYWMQKKDGLCVRIDDALQNVEDFANAIRNQTYEMFYTRASNAYNYGQTVNFGSINLSRQEGIIIGKRTISWPDIQQVSVASGVLNIKPRKSGLFGTVSMPVSVIHNLEVFLAIVDQVVGVNRPAEPRVVQS